MQCIFQRKTKLHTYTASLSAIFTPVHCQEKNHNGNLDPSRKTTPVSYESSPFLPPLVVCPPQVSRSCPVPAGKEGLLISPSTSPRLAPLASPIASRPGILQAGARVAVLPPSPPPRRKPGLGAGDLGPELRGQLLPELVVNTVMLYSDCNC